MTYALSGALLLSVLAFLWLPRRLAMCNGYMFLTSILYVNIGGAQVRWRMQTRGAELPGDGAWRLESEEAFLGSCLRARHRFGMMS